MSRTVNVGIRKVGREPNDAGMLQRTTQKPEHCVMWQGQAVHEDAGVITLYV